MANDEILAKIKGGVLSVYCKSGNRAGVWQANTVTTAAVSNGNVSGTSGTIIETSNGLYQVSVQIIPAASTSYALNTIVYDGAHYQKVTTAGTTGSAWPPAWNHSGGTTSSGTAVFTDYGTTWTPTTGATIPSSWGETGFFANATAITVDGTTMWRYAGEACPSDTSFALLGSVSLAGFAGGFPGIWAATDPTAPGGGEYVFQDVRLGSGDPCGSQYTCTGGQQSPVAVWMQ